MSLRKEGIFLPEKRIINRLDGYSLHLNGEVLLLTHKENKTIPIATVFRGNGPRFSTFPDLISFDDFLLSYAQDIGAEVIPERVKSIELPKRRSDRAIVSYGRGTESAQIEADLVVGAFGINTALMEKLKDLGFGYQPPSTLVTYQTDMKIGEEDVRKHFGNTIHVYMPKSATIRYATVVPKRDFVTITLIGRKNAGRRIFEEFLNWREVQKEIPAHKPRCFCSPRIAVSPAKKPFTDRLVIIGDASFSRHYKNGIESAFLTAKMAAETSVKFGIGEKAFASHYFYHAEKTIVRDNFYGRMLFFFDDLASTMPLLTRTQLAVAKTTNSNRSGRVLRSVLWNMFTGNIPYKDIFKSSLNVGLQLTLIWTTIKLLYKDLIQLVKGPERGKKWLI
jgi:flavin-dependent dehydrogenase